MKPNNHVLPASTNINSVYFWLLAVYLVLSVLLEGLYFPLEYLLAAIVFLALVMIAVSLKWPFKGVQAIVLGTAFILVTFAAAWFGVDRGQSIIEAYRYLLYVLVFITSMQIAPAQISKIYKLLFATGLLLAFFSLSTIMTDFFISSIAGDYRLQGTFAYANTTAIYLLITIVLGLYLGNLSRGPQKMVFISGTYLAAAALFLTGSRTVWLLWPVALLLAVAFAPVRERRFWLIYGPLVSFTGIVAGYFAHLNWSTQHNAMAGLIIAIGLLVVGGGLAPLLSHFENRVRVGAVLGWGSGMVILLGLSAGLIVLGSSTGRTLAWSASELQGRLIYYTDALSIIRDHFWLGIGGGGWTAMQFLYQTAYYNVTLVHSSLLQVALDTGMIGLGLFVGIIAMPIIYIVKSKEQLFRDETYSMMWPALLAGGLIFVHGLVDMDLSFPGAAGAMFFFLSVPIILGSDTPKPAKRWLGKWAGIRWAATGVLALLAVGAGVLWQSASLAIQGDRLCNAGDHHAAVEYYQKSLAFYPWSAQAFNKLGQAEEKMANLQPQGDALVLAYNAYVEAHRLSLYQPVYLENLAYTSLLLSRNDESSAYFLELTEKNPMVIRHYENLAYALIAAGEIQKGQEPSYYETVLEIPKMIDKARAKVSARGWKLRNTPQLIISDRLNWKLGQAEFRLGNTEKARSLWKKASSDRELLQEMGRWAAENKVDLGL